MPHAFLGDGKIFDLSIPDPTPQVSEDGKHRYVVLAVAHPGAEGGPATELSVKLPLHSDAMDDDKQESNDVEYYMKVKRRVDICAAVCKYVHPPDLVFARRIKVGKANK